MAEFVAVTAEAIPWFSPDYLNHSIDEAEPFTGIAIERRWVLRTSKAVLKYLKEMKQPLQIILADAEVEAVNPQHSFSVTGAATGEKHVVLLLQGRFIHNQVHYSAVLLVLGNEATLLNVREIIRASNSQANVIQPEELEAIETPARPIQQNRAIGMPEYIAYIASEDNLLKLLKMNQLTQVTKILSTIVSMFPYSIEPLRAKVDVLYFTGDASEEINAEAPPGLGHSEPDQGDALTAMGLFLLGMAYSNANRFPEQITRRLRAVAATLGSNPPDRRTVDAAIQACHWQTDDLPTIVDDALGYFICWTSAGVPNPEAKLSDLMTMDHLQITYQLSPAAVALLDQARLIYLHYHATSINFISQVLPALQEGGHTTNAYLAADITAYSYIADRVSSAPFLGLRGQLPEAFQIRTMSKLVYCALLYYQASLEDEDERRNFSEYKIADIKNHVHPKEAQSFIETLVGTLPRPSVTTIADLVAVLPLEKAHVLMAGKTAAFNCMILEIYTFRELYFQVNFDHRIFLLPLRMSEDSDNLVLHKIRKIMNHKEMRSVKMKILTCILRFSFKSY